MIRPCKQASATETTFTSASPQPETYGPEPQVHPSGAPGQLGLEPSQQPLPSAAKLLAPMLDGKLFTVAKVYVPCVLFSKVPYLKKHTFLDMSLTTFHLVVRSSPTHAGYVLQLTALFIPRAMSKGIPACVQENDDRTFSRLCTLSRGQAGDRGNRNIIDSGGSRIPSQVREEA
ncbi:hypothetical protein Vretifemale_784 [Volvox reticuliferus]|uniref:Uncharacterized protein n=1 Tax=Volvox reticuliferus TaxID=1737510 RepID=A0A8J4BVG3_9CHLO|nr:hypothetical protein Vretifemale_784 [Volvox reticuliferus]